ncbi:MAG: hypothetical protein KC657_36560 [Myxococcales bacterium]|nr:hypothetical protein [Myxococcales bacterium]
MSELRWEWTLPSGAIVAATLDPETGTEAVYVGDRLVSRSGRAEKPDGHVVTELSEDDGSERPAGLVKFDPTMSICVHRSLDGFELRPHKWPAPRSKVQKAPPARPFPLGIVVVVTLVGLVVALGFTARSMLQRRGSKDAPEIVTHRAKNGRFVARYPGRLDGKDAVSPGQMSGLIVEDPDSGDTLVVMAVPLAPGAPHDVWSVHKRMFPESLANLPRKDATYHEAAREDRTCRGEPGAFVQARVLGRKGEPRDVYACVFTHKGAAYVITTMVRDGTRADKVQAVEASLASIELTSLEDLAGGGL